MAAHRTSMQIAVDVLTVTKDAGMTGIKTTALLSKANLSHSRLGKFLGRLIGSDMLSRIEYDGKHVYVITPKGRQFLQTYRQFYNIAESFGLSM